MLIASVLGLAVVSIGLMIVAVMLRSRSVATLNFVICLFAGILIWFSQPSTAFALRPPAGADEDMRLYWIARMISLILISTGVLALVYTIVIHKILAVPKRLKRRRRRSRSSRAPLATQAGVGSGNGDVEKDGVPPGRV